MKDYLFLLLILLALCSCQSPKKQQVEDTIKSSIEKSSQDKASLISSDSVKNLTEVIDTKPNDGFRVQVLPSFTNNNDIEIVRKVLNKLDQKQLSLCSVIKQLFEIDDQCLAAARKEFPDPSHQESFSKVYSDRIKREYEKYGRLIDLSMDEIRFINVAYAFHEPVKSFCGKF